MKKNKNILKDLVPYLMLLVIVSVIYYVFNMNNVKVNDINYNEFITNLKAEKVKELEITPKNSESVYYISGKLDGYSKNESFKLIVPFTDSVIDNILDISNEQQLDVKINKDSGSISWIAIIFDFIPIILITGLSIYLVKAMMGNGKGGALDFGRSRAKLNQEGGKVTFKDVAGLNEEKEEVKELIDFLKNPKKFQKLGARIPKGVLLVGPPGTGKTLLAKAVAGEAKVPFFSLSGSSFVEMFVGVGASRVRELFREAEQKAPCIIFIDEIDAIGKSRDNQFQSNDEREQTLNQLLSEMDGFDSSKGIVILGATNRPEILDKALLRPGRFDRRVIVDRPDLIGREAILKVHAKDVCLNADVDLKEIAKGTPGAVGADLANIVNEAALRAVRNKRNQVLQEDLREAVEVIIAGKEKKDRILSPMEKKIVAFHEVGHALVAALLKGTDPVHKITIVPRTMGALGYTMQLPEEEKYLVSKDELMNQIKVMLGGRSAEEEVFNIVSTGASNDIERATQSARNMVTIYGMTDKFDMVALESVQNRYLDGRAVRNCSEETSTIIDEEVLRIIREAHKEARQLLRDNRDLLDKIAGILLEKETIFGDEFMNVVCEKYPELRKEEKKESKENEESINLSKESEDTNTSKDKDTDTEAMSKTAKDSCDDEFVEIGEKKSIELNKNSEE